MPNVRVLVGYHVTGRNEVAFSLNYPLCSLRVSAWKSYHSLLVGLKIEYKSCKFTTSMNIISIILNIFACLVLYIYTTQSSFDHRTLQILMWYRSSSMHTIQGEDLEEGFVEAFS